MTGTVRTRRSFGEWWNAHFGLITIVGLLALILAIALIGAAIGNHAGA